MDMDIWQIPSCSIKITCFKYVQIIVCQEYLNKVACEKNLMLYRLKQKLQLCLIFDLFLSLHIAFLWTIIHVSSAGKFPANTFYWTFHLVGPAPLFLEPCREGRYKGNKRRPELYSRCWQPQWEERKPRGEPRPGETAAKRDWQPHAWPAGSITSTLAQSNLSPPLFLI